MRKVQKTLPKTIFWFGIFPNLLFWVAGHLVYMMRPVVNIDYLLIGILAAFLPLAWTALLFGLVFANEILVLGAPIYHFQIVDLFLWWRDVLLINWRYSLPLALLFLFLVIGASILVTRNGAPVRKPLRTATVLFLLSFLICTADILNGTSFILLPIHESFVNFNIAYSGARRSLLSLRDLLEMTAFAGKPLAASESAAGALLAEARAGAAELPKTQVAVVVVESMGEFNDPLAEKALLAPLEIPEIAKRYDVQIGTVPFHGHTIDGELRELCGVRLGHYGEEGFPKCLPKYLDDEGFETVGLHGFTNQFYNRYRWYPKLGFDRYYFAEDMSSMGMQERCGSGFTGICDTAVADLVHRELLHSANGKRKFVYWMTLNSHLPLDSESSRESKFDCKVSPETRDFPAVCLHTRMVSLVLSSLAKIAADPALPATEFIVVGDHMPPFATSSIRGLYSQERVPFIVLKPRG